MTLLLDTDVLIDIALDCRPYSEHAADLLNALEERPGTAFIAWHTISNFHYLVAPRRGRRDAKSFLVELARFVDVAPTTTESLRYAASLQMADFQDLEAALQVAAAIACQADVIATRNLADYMRSPIPAATPESLRSRQVCPRSPP